MLQGPEYFFKILQIRIHYVQTKRFRELSVCQSCNYGKGGRRLYEWKGLRAKDAIPRIAEGKYLKLLYDLHDKRGTLNIDKKELGRTMCPACDLKPRCFP